MSNFHKELFLEIVDGWNNADIEAYIQQLIERLEDTRATIRELRSIQKRRTKAKGLDTGTRGGK